MYDDTIRVLRSAVAQARLGGDERLAAIRRLDAQARLVEKAAGAMPISEYLRGLRSRVGSALLVVPSVTGLIFDDEDRVLLVRHSNGDVWVAPGGAVDPDEAPQDALVREVWEETGLHVEPTSLRGVFGGPGFRVTYANGDEVSYVMAVFECRRVRGELRADREEILEARYVATSELRTLALANWARVILPPLTERTQRDWIPAVSWQPPSAR